MMARGRKSWALLVIPVLRIWLPPEAPDASRFLMKALDSASLDPRVAEGLPWVLANLDLNWEWLLETAKEHNHRNRLGFLLDLAVDVVKAKGNSERAATLELHLADLEMMRSDQQDTFCQESMSEVTRRHVLARRSKTAEHWNLVTDFSLAYLDQAFE
jgi:hypothetical protein